MLRLSRLALSAPGNRARAQQLVHWTRAWLSTAIDSRLKNHEIIQMLQEAGVDFRDCLERSELVARLDERRRFLPLHVRSRLDALLASRDGDAARGQEQHQHQNDGGARSAALAAAGGFSPAAAAPSLFPDGAGSFAASGLFLDEQHTVQLFQRCRPSVVHIASAEAASGISGRGGGLPLLDPQRVPRVGMGTGFVWDQLGHVVTNYHVIHNTFEVQVTLADNSKWVAELRGKEPDKDLAVLRIRAPAEKLVPIEVGSSSRLAVGQKVFAIGNPFGLDHTLTAGIVSGLGREMKSLTHRTISDVVQTDASINPGNSGGPLLDSRGRLIGVNTAATSHPLTTAGFGFAIPSDTVRRVVNQLIRHGRVVRPSLGVLLMNDQHSRMLLGPAPGVVVHSVVEGSGAAQAGIRGIRSDAFANVYLGDVIVAVGGGPQLATMEDLISHLEQFNVGDLVPLTLHRYDGGGSYLDRRYQEVKLPVPLLKEVSAAAAQ